MASEPKRAFQTSESERLENVIFQRFRVIRWRSPFHVRFFSVSLSSENARFRLLMICASRKCYLAPIPSHQVEIHICFDILLSMSLWSKNDHFRLLIISTSETVTLQRYGMIRLTSTFHVRFCSLSLSSQNARFTLLMICTTGKFLSCSDSES